MAVTGGLKPNVQMQPRIYLDMRLPSVGQSVLRIFVGAL